MNILVTVALLYDLILKTIELTCQPHCKKAQTLMPCNLLNYSQLLIFPLSETTTESLSQWVESVVFRDVQNELNCVIYSIAVDNSLQRKIISDQWLKFWFVHYSIAIVSLQKTCCTRVIFLYCPFFVVLEVYNCDYCVRPVWNFHNLKSFSNPSHTGLEWH